jgi:hypothetical protein
VSIPGLPDDLVQVGDELDLSVQVTPSSPPMFTDQSVVLGHGTDLVLFSTATWYVTSVPKLDAYGITVAYGDPTCSFNLFGSCLGTEPSVLVSRGTDTTAVGAGVTAQAGDLSVSVGETFVAGADFLCSQLDPPNIFRYGGFRPRQ